MSSEASKAVEEPRDDLSTAVQTGDETHETSEETDNVKTRRSPHLRFVSGFDLDLVSDFDTLSTRSATPNKSAEEEEQDGRSTKLKSGVVRHKDILSRSALDSNAHPNAPFAPVNIDNLARRQTSPQASSIYPPTFRPDDDLFRCTECYNVIPRFLLESHRDQCQKSFVCGSCLTVLPGDEYKQHNCVPRAPRQDPFSRMQTFPRTIGDDQDAYRSTRGDPRIVGGPKERLLVHQPRSTERGRNSSQRPPSTERTRSTPRSADQATPERPLRPPHPPLSIESGTYPYMTHPSNHLPYPEDPSSAEYSSYYVPYQRETLSYPYSDSARDYEIVRQEQDIRASRTSRYEHDPRIIPDSNSRKFEVIGKPYLDDSAVPCPGDKFFAEKFVEMYGRERHRPVVCTLSMRDAFGPFLAEQMEPGDSFWDLVVLVGDPLAYDARARRTQGACALTCGEYVKKTWPRSAEKIKKLFSLLSTNDTAISSTKELMNTSYGDVKIVARQQLVQSVIIGHESKDRELTVEFDGPAPSQTDLVEALIWLYTVIQTGPDINRPIESYVDWGRKILATDNRSIAYSIACDTSTALPVPTESACWTPLFPRTACAWQFPTKHRPAGLEGLELSFELMCVVCGLEYEVIKDGGLILCGQNSMIYPVRQVGDSIQWHFQHLDREAISNGFLKGERLLVDDLESLRDVKRHFLGLWSEPQITLGTDFNDSAPLLGWSSAVELPKETYRDGYTFGGSVNLPRVLSLSWATHYKFARNRKNMYMTDFASKLDSMKAAPVMLYSPSEKRAWMVSYVSVVLHLARARAKMQRDLGFHIPPCESHGNGGQAALDCLLTHHRQPLKRAATNEVLHEDELKFTIGNYVQDVMAAMDELRRESCRGKGLLRGFRERIIGFEMADIARMKTTSVVKQHKFETLASSCWAPLLDQVELTFFCENLPDPIVPGTSAELAGVCGESTWREIPKGFNLLAVSLPCLAYISEPLNGPLLHRLAPGFTWSSPGKIFGSCQSARRHVCSRLQELSSSSQHSLLPELSVDTAKQNGAVVFKYKADSQAIQDALPARRPRNTVRTGDEEAVDVGDDSPPLKARERRSTLEIPPARHRGSNSDSGYSSTNTPKVSQNSMLGQPSKISSPGGSQEEVTGEDPPRDSKERLPQKERTRKHRSQRISRTSDADASSGRPRIKTERKRDDRDSPRLGLFNFG